MPTLNVRRAAGRRSARSVTRRISSVLRLHLPVVALTAGLVISLAPAVTTAPAASATPQVHEAALGSDSDTLSAGQRLDGLRVQDAPHASPSHDLSAALTPPTRPSSPRKSKDDEAAMMAPKKKGDPWIHIDKIRPGDGPAATGQSVHGMYKASGVSARKLKSQNRHAAAGTSTTPPGPSQVPGLVRHVTPSCTGTGTDGSRVQVLYARETGQSDRFGSFLPLLKGYVANIDDVFAVSSVQTGGGKRVRWVQDASCEPDIRQVVLPTGSLGSSATATFSALRAAGYDAINRKYLVFAEGYNLNNGTACGVGEVYPDTRPTGNLNDGYASQMSRVDCWATSVAAHELMHTLGAVQGGGPHATASGHCTDASEIMCYSDATGTTAQVCPKSNDSFYDCNHDDYFSTNPPAGSYLATHWNTANSAYLNTVPALPAAPTMSVTSSKASMLSGEAVTLTAVGDRALDYAWTSSPSDNGPSSWGCHFDVATAATVHLTCDALLWNNEVTVTVTGTDRANNVTATSETTFALSLSAEPSVTVTGPDRAEADTTLTYTATPQGVGPFTYRWKLPGGSCVFVGADNQPSVSITCPAAKVNEDVDLGVTLTQGDRQTTTRMFSYNQRIVLTPKLALKGPTQVEGGTSAKFTVTGAPAAWTSARGWLVDYNPDSGIATVNPPRDATGTDTLTAWATASDWTEVTKTITYQVTPSLSVRVTGPDSVIAGDDANLTATPSRPVAITWATSDPDCTVVESGTGATLSCALSFTGPVDVTATADDPANGAHTTGTHRVSVTAPPKPPTATITGPAALTAGRPGTYRATAQDFPADDPAATWAWTANQDCLIGSATTTTLTVRCDAAAAGAVGLTLTATSHSGSIVRSTVLSAALTKPTSTLTVTSDATTLTPGSSTTVRAALTGNGGGLRSTLLIDQSSDGKTWTSVGSGSYQAADGTLTLGVTPSRTTTYRFSSGSVSKSVTVTLVRVATTSTITAKTTGTTVALTGTLRRTTGGAAVAGATVPVQVKWYGTADWVTLRTVTTTVTGAMSFSYNMTTRAGTFRFAYDGTTVYAPATTASAFVKVPTKITATVRLGRPNTLTATAATASGTGLSQVYLTLQRRTTTGTWAKEVTVRTNTKGVAVAKVSPGRSAAYRWVLAVSATHNEATSATQTVKR